MKSVGKRSVRVDYTEFEEAESDFSDVTQSDSEDSEEESSDDLTLADYQEKHAREIVPDPLDQL